MSMAGRCVLQSRGCAPSKNKIDSWPSQGARRDRQARYSPRWVVLWLWSPLLLWRMFSMLRGQILQFWGPKWRERERVCVCIHVCLGVWTSLWMHAQQAGSHETKTRRTPDLRTESGRGWEVECSRQGWILLHHGCRADRPTTELLISASNGVITEVTATVARVLVSIVRPSLPSAREDGSTPSTARPNNVPVCITVTKRPPREF